MLDFAFCSGDSGKSFSSAQLTDKKLMRYTILALVLFFKALMTRIKTDILSLGLTEFCFSCFLLIDSKHLIWVCWMISRLKCIDLLTNFILVDALAFLIRRYLVKYWVFTTDREMLFMIIPVQVIWGSTSMHTTPIDSSIPISLSVWWGFIFHASVDFCVSPQSFTDYCTCT